MLFVPRFSGNEFTVVLIAFHVIINVNELPVFEVKSVIHHILLVGVINQAENWGRPKHTFKYSDVIAGVALIIVNLSGSACKLANLAIC